MNKRGFTAKAFESGSGVGGTWYWNRYPGARTDSESWVYIFTFLEEIGLQWDWKERFPTQPEVEEYLNKVTDHLNLRKQIQFNTRVTTARRDAVKNSWIVTTSDGQTHTARFLITATGPLATPLEPPFPGLETFKGEWYQTGLWPKSKSKFDFREKRVGVVGTGATGVQVIPIVAHNAKSLTVFQRTPSYVLPARNHPLTDDQRSELKRECEKVWSRARTQAFGMDMVDATAKAADLTEAEITKILDYGWEIGGFHFVFETFADLLTSDESNGLAAEFVRQKIRTIVKDKKKAEILCPKYALLAKRPPLGHYYYECFNRDNVEIVDISQTPIEAITPTGIKTATEQYDLDIIIFAIGFDAVTGTLAQIDLRGSDDQLLGEQLRDSLATGYGITVQGFPNLFMVSGPQAPFANIPVIIDNTVKWIGETVSYMRAQSHECIETTEQLAQRWNKQVNAAFDSTVLKKSALDANSWFIGANVKGKPTVPLMWFGGVPAYFAHCQSEVDNGYSGYVFLGGASSSDAVA